MARTGHRKAGTGQAAVRAAQLRSADTGLRRSTRLQGGEAEAATTAEPAPQLPGRIVKTPKQKQIRYDCTTCDRNLAASSFPKYLPTDNCKHLINTCRACLKAWISAQLDSTTYDKISCPQCPEILQNSDMQIHATDANYQRFDELECKGIAEKIPGWRWCLRPKCKAGQVHQPLVKPKSAKTDAQVDTRTKIPRTVKKSRIFDDDKVCTCKEGGARACVECDRPYHEDQTCEAYQQRMKDDEDATLKVIAAECKQCPSCNKNIQKAGGCDHMVCSQCYTQFCWHCRVTYDVINNPNGGGHGDGCVYALPGRVDPHAANFQHHAQLAAAHGMPGGINGHHAHLGPAAGNFNAGLVNAHVAAGNANAAAFVGMVQGDMRVAANWVGGALPGWLQQRVNGGH
jgi:hypothetical protein